MKQVIFPVVALFIFGLGSTAQQVKVNGAPAELNIRQAGENSIRVTLKPQSFASDFVETPALAYRSYTAPAITVREIRYTVSKRVGKLQVAVSANPLAVKVANNKGQTIQHIVFNEDGSLRFQVGAAPVLGLGEGGSKPLTGVNWRALPVEYDRRSMYDSMQPRWQADAYGSRNPVPFLIGTEGWGLFVVAPWVHVDLRNDNYGLLIPWKPADSLLAPQNEKNQSLNGVKGLPPVDKIVPGLLDLFVFDAHDPVELMKDFSVITGPAAMPPKWALGYMQSHRTLEDDRQMVAIVDTFRSKQIPLDAVIYLGTGFTPRGWNTKQPSFSFNPEVFKRAPKQVIADIHARNAKVVVHMVPWDRDRLPELHGNIPAKAGEVVNASHLQNYWNEHMGLIHAGIDAFWPDEGDWFNLYERIKRHQLYYQGHLSANPNVRPWSLQRNGFPGIAQWGGWVWSGDTESSWKTLEAQIAVGLNYSLTIGPYWGTDIGGFFPNEELTGELYARWFQFGAFNASFRSHGVTWWTRLPWGWGLPDMGPKEGRRTPLQSEMNNKMIEPIVKRYDQLRYQLMPYTYTLAWEAYTSGLPLMRPLWMHYPYDTISRKTGDQFLWGRDLLIAPVYTKGATERSVYLPKGKWYDWWNGQQQEGGRYVSKKVDLSVMPIYVRAGAIIPVDTIRQYVAQNVATPTTVKIFSGADGAYEWYEDDGISMAYLEGTGTRTKITWQDSKRTLIIEAQSSGQKQAAARTLRVQLLPEGVIKELRYAEKKIVVSF